MSLAQIGEFSFIIASVGVASQPDNATMSLLYTVAVAVSAMTTLLTPWLIRAAEPTAAWVDRKLPRSLQTFAALYGSWLDQIGSRSADNLRSRIRGFIRWLIVDAAVLAAIVIGASVEHEQIADWVEWSFGIPEEWTKVAVVAGACLLAAPFAIGLARVARFLGFELALRVFPVTENELDLAAAPRRLLVVTLQLAIVIVVGVPLLTITAPFLPPYSAAGVLLFVLLLLALAFWRGATNFQGHTRAAAQALAESLTRQTRKGRVVGEMQEAAHQVGGVDHLFAGMGTPTPVELTAGAEAIGKTLAEIKLRGLTGATVLAIQRGQESIPVPSGHERLLDGDILAVAGTQEAIAAAKELLSARHPNGYESP